MTGTLVGVLCRPYHSLGPAIDTDTHEGFRVNNGCSVRDGRPLNRGLIVEGAQRRVVRLDGRAAPERKDALSGKKGIHDGILCQSVRTGRIPRPVLPALPAQ